MRYHLGYGRTVQEIGIPDGMLLDILLPNEMAAGRKGAEELAWALDNPIGSGRLEDLVKKGQNVVIVTSDITRPMPSYAVLPAVLDRLNGAGIPDRDITVVFAVGSHRAHTQEEQRKLVGEEVYSRVKCEDACAGAYIHMGWTSRGTPITISETVAKADFRICLGNIEYHYFAGYSGGAKAIMPGVSDKETIQANHSRMMDESARIATLSGNVIREDLEECLQSCPVDFLLNVVLDENKEIVKAVAGDVILAHREGCRFVDQLYMKEIPARADIVIASIGGAPKDINLYQTQKALENAAYAVKKGGAVILVGACGEGFGNPVFERWLLEAACVDDIVARIRTAFQLGGHKAAAIAGVLKNAAVYLVSEIPDELVKKAFLIPADDVQSAFDRALEKMGGTAKVYIMPFAGSTLPVENRGRNNKNSEKY